MCLGGREKSRSEVESEKSAPLRGRVRIHREMQRISGVIDM